MENERNFEVELVVVHSEDFTVGLGSQRVFYLDHHPSIQEVAAELPWGEVVGWSYDHDNHLIVTSRNGSYVVSVMIYQLTYNLISPDVM